MKEIKIMDCLDAKEERLKATKEEWMKMLDDGFVYHQEGNVIMI